MVVGEQTPKAAIRRLKRVLKGGPHIVTEETFPFRIYSTDSLVTVDRDELELILADYEDLKYRMEGLEK